MATVTRPGLLEALERARIIAREVLAPNAARVDREAAFPSESVAAIREAGLLGLLVPREYGGLDTDPWTFSKVVMELGRACPSTAMIYVMHCGVVRNMTRWADDATQRRFLPRIARGELLLCSNRNEPQASTTQGYIGELQESLTPTPDGGYRFTASKFFATGSSAADYFCVLGRLAGSAPGQAELWVLIPRDDPGLEVIENWDTLGLRGTRSNYVNYRNCRVEPDAMLGRPSSGQFGDYTILGQALVSLAIGESALDFGIRFLRGEIGEINTPWLAKDANAQRVVGELEMMLEASRLITHQACLALDRGGEAGEAMIRPAINRAWYYSKPPANEVPHRVLQLVGGRGTFRWLPLERLVRDGEAIALMGPSMDALATGIGKTSLDPATRWPGLWLE